MPIRLVSDIAQLSSSFNLFKADFGHIHPFVSSDSRNIPTQKTIQLDLQTGIHHSLVLVVTLGCLEWIKTKYSLSLAWRWHDSQPQNYHEICQNHII